MDSFYDEQFPNLSSLSAYITYLELQATMHYAQSSQSILSRISVIFNKVVLSLIIEMLIKDWECTVCNDRKVELYLK